MIEVLEAGLATSVQDTGRTGYYRYGIPPSGAVDAYSSRAANILVGNAEDAAVLECTYLGPRLRFTEPAVVAVTGADMPAQIAGEEVPGWAALRVTAGDELSFTFLRAGARAYVAVRGGIDVPEVLGSRSTYGIAGFGGHEGRTLRVGDSLVVGDSPSAPPAAEGFETPRDLRPVLARENDVRVVMGLYDDRLTDRGRADFLAAAWTLTPVADRVGFRYCGAQLEWVEREQPFGAGADPSNIVDAGYPIGSIQVPAGSEPIVLHRDAVSGGGYAMVATVISADMDVVGQSAPGTTTRFVEVDLDEALAARAHRAERLELLRWAARP